MTGYNSKRQMAQDKEALKLALEALNTVYWDGGGSCWQVDADKIEQAVTKCNEALAQPAQEPVACVQDLDEVKRKHLVYQKGMDWKDPLYTTPPQRPWVGLTEDEIVLVIADCAASHQHTDIHLARAIEQALKEKNNGSR